MVEENVFLKGGILSSKTVSSGMFKNVGFHPTLKIGHFLASPWTLHGVKSHGEVVTDFGQSWPCTPSLFRPKQTTTTTPTQQTNNNITQHNTKMNWPQHLKAHLNWPLIEDMRTWRRGPARNPGNHPGSLLCQGTAQLASGSRDVSMDGTTRSGSMASLIEESDEKEGGHPRWGTKCVELLWFAKGASGRSQSPGSTRPHSRGHPLC